MEESIAGAHEREVLTEDHRIERCFVGPIKGSPEGILDRLPRSAPSGFEVQLRAARSNDSKKNVGVRESCLPRNQSEESQIPHDRPEMSAADEILERRILHEDLRYLRPVDAKKRVIDDQRRDVDENQGFQVEKKAGERR